MHTDRTLKQMKKPALLAAALDMARALRQAEIRRSAQKAKVTDLTNELVFLKSRGLLARLLDTQWDGVSPGARSYKQTKYSTEA